MQKEIAVETFSKGRETNLHREVVKVQDRVASDGEINVAPLDGFKGGFRQRGSYKPTEGRKHRLLIQAKGMWELIHDPKEGPIFVLLLFSSFRGRCSRTSNYLNGKLDTLR